MEKIRAHREALKHAWFNMDHSNTPVRKEITIEMDKYPGRKGQGIVKILDEGPGSYSCFTTYQENPIEYAKERLKEDKYKEYKLIVNNG